MKLLKGLFNHDIKANDDGTFDFIGSDSSVDRDGEIIEVGGWDLKHFNKNPVILFGHNHQIPAIARAKKAVVENGKLIIKGIRFAKRGIHDLADTVHDLIVDKIMKAGSVGFIAHDREFIHRDEETGKKPKASIITKKAELHEFSMVNVGSNRNALRVKGFLGEDDELNVDEILAKLPKDTDIKKIEDIMFAEKSNDDITCDGEFCLVDGKNIKGVSLARVLNNAIDRMTNDDTSRGDIIRRIASASGVGASTIGQILNGSINCPPLRRLRGFVRVLGMSMNSLVSAAERDGCDYGDQERSVPNESENNISILIDKVTTVVDSQTKIIKLLTKDNKTIYDTLLDGDSDNQNHNDPSQKRNLGSLFNKTEVKGKKLKDLFK